jgi:DNA-3-methyladenine glycosylase
MASSITSRRAATLPVSFFRRPAEIVARELVGTLIVSTVRGVLTAGRIVETEAYLGHRDPASHAFANRRHARNENLYGPAGTWYVYLSYGMHWCANLVCGTTPNEGAVLLRAVEPLEGLPTMRRRRGGVADRLLASGPGRLTQALGITLSLDGLAMRESNVVVQAGGGEELDVAASLRIGITKAVDWPLRFAVRGSKWVSRTA